MNRLASLSTRAPEGLNKEQVKEATRKLLEELNELQNRLYAGGQYAVLAIFQGMDASGKDGAIKKVLSQLNPLGVHAFAFKKPTEEEKAHDFLWRIHQKVPAKGMIHAFNRSQYEEVLITRVHGWCDDKTARQRFKAINDFEELLQNNQTILFKFYLHLSREEQQERLQERITRPEKRWKHDPGDQEEAQYWDVYMKMYEDVFEHCNVQPWTIIPADQNWYKEYCVAKTLVEGLKTLNLTYPDKPVR
jgi:PPK2 family polyphosphate:nucleotide phosphotransferase